METAQLKRIPLFADTPDEKLRLVAQFAQSKEFSDGTTLIKEGGFSNELMAIEEGKAEVQRDGKKVADLGPGDFFGEAGLLDKSQRNASVIAKTPVKLIVISEAEVARLRTKAPEIVDQLKKAVEERAG